MTRIFSRFGAVVALTAGIAAFATPAQALFLTFEGGATEHTASPASFRQLRRHHSGYSCLIRAARCGSKMAPEALNTA